MLMTRFGDLFLKAPKGSKIGGFTMIEYSFGPSRKLRATLHDIHIVLQIVCICYMKISCFGFMTKWKKF